MSSRVRSILFVPGTKTEWIGKAVAAQADAVILDLEDAVSEQLKGAARAEVGRALSDAQHLPILRLVRVNAFRTGHLLLDLEAVVGAGLDGIVLPKAGGADEVRAMAFILDELEITRELDVGRIEIFPIAETAGAMKDVFEICSASPRVRRISGVAHSVPGGDYYRSLGAQWHSDGIEALYSGSMTVMAGRAAGLESILCGPIAAIADLDHVRDVLLRGRGLGANAAMVIHPSHIALVHEVFAPTRAEIAEALEVLRTMSAAEARGEAAVVVGGRMVDLVHVRTSQEIVRRAIEAGLDVGDGVAGTAGE